MATGLVMLMLRMMLQGRAGTKGRRAREVMWMSEVVLGV